jgi:hypothetical protein
MTAILLTVEPSAEPTKILLYHQVETGLKEWHHRHLAEGPPNVVNRLPVAGLGNRRIGTGHRIEDRVAARTDSEEEEIREVEPGAENWAATVSFNLLTSWTAGGVSFRLRGMSVRWWLFADAHYIGKLLAPRSRSWLSSIKC